MKLLYKFVAFVYKALAAFTGKEPVEYLAEMSVKDGVPQDRFNLMIDRLELS